jgi:hypothetical protein
MPTLTIQYVYFAASGSHTRQPRATTSYGGFTPIPGLNGAGTATLMTGSAYQPPPADPTITVGTLVLNFAFVNVCGCTEGARLSFVASMSPPVGTVGTIPILVNYVYLPQGNGSSPTTGAVIDAYNQTSGTLVDNDFVTVSPDSSGSLTTTANVDGWVDTTSSGYTITADHPNIGAYLSDPTNLIFQQWVDLATPTPPTSLISGANLTPGKGVTVYALAFYAVPSTPTPPKLKEVAILEKIHSKEPEKEYPGAGGVDRPSKYTEGIKGPKESEGYGPGNQGDPGNLSAQVQSLNQRVSTLEANAAQQGAAFIKPADRPSVKPEP